MKFLIKLAVLIGLIYGAIYFTDYDKNVRYGYDIHSIVFKPLDAGVRIKMKKSGAEIWKLEEDRETMRFYTFNKGDK